MRRLAVAGGLVVALGALGVGAAIAASGGTPRAQAGATVHRTAVMTTLLRSRPWTLRALRNHGRIIVIRYTEGDCWGAAQAHVTQKRTSVTIELLQAYSGGAGVACAQFLMIRALDVHLRATLGHRRLIHAPLGATPGQHPGVIPPPGLR
jgi:hypothetical protein